MIKMEALKKIEGQPMDNMVELVYQITIMRHKLKMLWFSIKKAEGNIKKTETEDNLDEESK